MPGKESTAKAPSAPSFRCFFVLGDRGLRSLGGGGAGGAWRCVARSGGLRRRAAPPAIGAGRRSRAGVASSVHLHEPPLGRKNFDGGPNRPRRGGRAEVGADDFVVLVPAFVTSELYQAFALGFAIYLPFLVIDLVVANVLLALGMQMLSPTQVSLPFKLLLFVAVDGWALLSQALVAGYRF